MKYIVAVVDGAESIFVFPRDVDHDRMKEAIECIRFGSERNWRRKFRDGEVISAGFVEDGRCYGRSETLSLDSRGELDTALLRGVKTKGPGSFTPIGKVVHSAPDANNERTARVDTYGRFDLEHVAAGTVLFSNGLIDSDQESAGQPRKASRAA
jgi:hypothetical protein